MSVVVVTLVGKPECHLCDAARDVVTSVIEQLEGEASAPSDRRSFVVDEKSIVDDPALRALYEDEIPVVLIDDRVHTIWRVDAARLRTALLEAAS